MKFMLIAISAIITAIIVVYILDQRYGISEIIHSHAYAKFIFLDSKEEEYIKLRSGWTDVTIPFEDKTIQKKIYLEENSQFIYFFYNQDEYVKIDPRIKSSQFFNFLPQEAIVIISKDKNIAFKIESNSSQKMDLETGIYHVKIKSNDKSYDRKIDIKDTTIILITNDDVKLIR